MTDNFKVIVPSERVERKGKFAIVDTGMSPDDFLFSVMQYVSNGKPTMGVVMQEESE